VEISALNFLCLLFFCFRKTDFYLHMVVSIVVMRRGFAIWEAEKLSRTSDSHSGGYEVDFQRTTRHYIPEDSTLQKN
jgi:hypothetical protein